MNNHVCLQAADLGISPSEYRNFAKEQLSYILGSAGRSYVVGYGRDFPKQPHHVARYSETFVFFKYLLHISLLI